MVDGTFALRTIAGMVLVPFAVIAESGPAGTIRSTVGAVQVCAVRQPAWKPARVNAKVFTGDTIKTGPESFTELHWSEGGVLRLAEKTMLAVSYQPTSSTPESGTKVTAGRVWANMKALASSGSGFAIESPTAISGIRGTVFRVDVAADSSTDVVVYQGSVAVGPGASLQKDSMAQRESTDRKEVEGPSEVEGPHEVTLREWVTIVAGQRIRVERDGSFRSWEFDRKRDGEDAWVRANLERDRALDKK